MYPSITLPLIAGLAKVTVTLFARSIVTVQALPVTAPQPVHPPTAESLDGVAVKITTAPTSKLPLHDVPQLIPEG